MINEKMQHQINDFISKQLFIEKNIVTFRSLSRQFEVHVNVAKNELARFHADARIGSQTQPAYATYLVCGEVSPVSNHSKEVEENEMDVDGELDEDGEEVPTVKMVLVSEQELEDVKSGYLRITSQHVYCLSPAPVLDAGFVCTPTPQIHAKDATLGPDAQATLGRITGSHVVVGKAAPSVTRTATVVAKAKEPPKASAPVSATIKKEDREELKRKGSTVSMKEVKVKEEVKEEKPKAKGSLDWGRAKVKGQATAKVEDKEDVKRKVKSDMVEKAVEKKEKADASKALAKGKEKAKLEPAKPTVQRGTKRKTVVVPSDTEGEESVVATSTRPSPPAIERTESQGDTAKKLAAKLKRNYIVSEDEDDELPLKVGPKGREKAKGKMKKYVSESEEEKEKSVRAMMDIDDEEVIKARPKTTRAPPPPSSSPAPEDTSANTSADNLPVPIDAPDSDIDMSNSYIDDHLPSNETKPARKKKKAWPVGRNGLKKRRVVKSRMDVDEKGYMVTQDYSEYESVDEEDAAEEGEANPKAKGRKSVSEKEEKEKMPPKKATKGIKEKPASRRTSSAGGVSKQGSLASFFAKKS